MIEIFKKFQLSTWLSKSCNIAGKLSCKILPALMLTVTGGCLSAAPTPHQIPEIEKPVAAPAKFYDSAELCWIDDLVEEAISQGDLPGAVVLVGQNEHIFYRKAFGHRALVPDIEPMTVDTVFDLASLTKVVATTTSIMQLVEAGRISLEDSVSKYIPQFERRGKGNITVRDLLTHMSGLRPGFNPAWRWDGYRAAIEKISNDVTTTKPGESVVYSDLNFIMLGEIVQRVSGMSLHQFANEHVFKPLGMHDTMYYPAADMKPRIAPSERCWKAARPCGGPDGTMLRGLVHDSAARRMGGGTGHAGLFSTADDLAIFCRMLLNSGAFGRTRILSTASVDAMIAPSTPVSDGWIRGLGWSLDTTFDGRLEKSLPLPIDHSGFTGTKLWLDTESGLYVVFLSNRLHPDGRGEVTDLRENIVTIAVSVAAGRTESAGHSSGHSTSSLAQSSSLPEYPHSRGRVLSGLDVLRTEDFARLRGRRIGLLTNQTGWSRDGVNTIDLLYRAENLQLVALFSPEHGVRGILEEHVPLSRDKKTGLMIHSLYGKRVRPTAEMLAGIDTIVVDLQDIGTRFYTYMTTMAYMLEAAAGHNVRVVVLDRPNPINGLQVEGPMLDQKFIGFTGYFPMPIRHGLTMGELAQLFNSENEIGADLTVVKMKGWQRQYWFDETGLPWINPSPNMRNLIQATLYPGIGGIEGSRISVGRGTDTPFEQIGAPWIDGVRLAADLNARDLAGVRFYPVSFIPQSSKYAGRKCQGVFILVTDRQALQPVRLGLEVARILHRLYPAEYRLAKEDNLLGSETALRHILADKTPAGLALAWQADEQRWRQLRRRYLLY